MYTVKFYRKLYEYSLNAHDCETSSPLVLIPFNVFVESILMNMWGMNLGAISHMFTSESLFGKCWFIRRPALPVCLGLLLSPHYSFFIQFFFCFTPTILQTQLEDPHISLRVVSQMVDTVSLPSHFPSSLLGEEPCWGLFPQGHLRRLYKFNKGIMALYQVKKHLIMRKFHNFTIQKLLVFQWLQRWMPS